jgi:hypothetical protein
LPFFNHPHRFAWGSLIAISLIPLPPVLACCRDCAHYGWAATVYVDVLDGTVLFAFAAMFFQRLHLGDECSQQPIGAVNARLHAVVRLIL